MIIAKRKIEQLFFWLIVRFSLRKNFSKDRYNFSTRSHSTVSPQSFLFENLESAQDFRASDDQVSAK